jgi:predicted transcriptional regulator
MDAVYSRGKATVADVLEALPDPPSYSAVRALMRILEEKGHLRHLQEGPRYLYQPTQPRQSAARSAMEHVVATFFGGSIEQAVTALLSDKEKALDDDEANRLAKIIEEARRTQGENHEVAPGDRKDEEGQK